MRRIHFFLFTLLLISSQSVAQGFIENQGQWDGPFHHKIDVHGGAAFLENQGIAFHLVDRSGIFGPHGEMDSTLADNIEHHHAFRFEFFGSNPLPSISGELPYDHHLNFFIGSDQNRWKPNVKPTRQVFYEKVYQGIDLRVKEYGSHIKYEFISKPSADFRDIRIKITGADDVHLDRDGNLIIATSVGDLKELKPKVFQTRGKKTWEVSAAFVLSHNTVSYQIWGHDTTLPLLIDPELIFSSFSGSTSDNWGYTATPDKAGNLYAGSGSMDDGYPTTTGAYDVSFNGPVAGTPADVSISKFSSDGTSLVYSTYLGGAGREVPHSMIVDASNNLYIFGTTSSNDFPTTTGAADRTFNGGPDESGVSFGVPYTDGADMFVTKLNSSGNALIGSTYLGGSGTDGLNISNATAYNYADEARGEINLDNNGNIIVVSATTSDDFPGTSNAFQPNLSGSTQDGVISKLNSNLTSVTWSSYLGNSGSDACYGVAIASNNSLYVCGGTNSSQFPTHNGAFQENYNSGRADGFLTHINAAGTSILHSTFFGSTSYDQMYLVQVDRDDHPHVFGQTENAGNHFIFGAAFNDVGGGQVLAHFRPDLESLVWSTQFGSTSGRPNISPTSFLVDVCNSVYLAGWGGSTQQFGNNNASDVGGLPVTGNAIKSTPDASESEFYLCVLDADANTQSYGSFFGGDQSGQNGGEHVDGGTSRFDRSGKIYQAVCAGCGGSSDFPVEPDPGAWSTTNQSNNCNLGVFKIDFELPIILADFHAPSFGCAPFTVNFNNQSVVQNATTFFWDFGNGNVSTTANPSQTYSQAGDYIVRLIVSDPNSCNLHDTLEHLITIKRDTSYTIGQLDTCIRTPIEIGPNVDDFGNLSSANISWIPGQFLSDPNILNPIATVGSNTTFVLTIDYGGCSERITQLVEVDNFDVETSNDTIVCSTFPPFPISGSAPGLSATYEWSRNGDFNPVLSTDSFFIVKDITDPITSFYFKATKPNGCAIIDTIQVTVSDWDINLTNDTAVCQDEDAIIRAISQNPNNTFHYFWTLEPYSSDPDQELITDTMDNFILINQSEPTTYYLYAKSSVVEGCHARDSVRINVSVLSQNLVTAEASQSTFYLGEKVQLTGSPGDGFFHYWTPGRYLTDSTSSTPIAQAKEEMTYVYTATDKDIPECSFKDTVTITPYEILCGEPEVFFPTAFSPDGDGINDIVKIHGSNIETVELAIYDRWGKLMFETNDKNESWDGTFDGNNANPGVYVFYYDLRCIDNQRVFRKGNITLMSR